MRREPVEIVDCPPRVTEADIEWAEWCAAVDASSQRLRDPGVREPLRCGPEGTPLDFGPLLA